VRKLDRIAWSRSGRPLAASDRKVMLAVLKRARREGRLQEQREPAKGDKPPT
jgi:hypothetical protein